jgi:hypothetical protein
VPVFDRLAERLQGDPVELGELVQEKDSVVGERHFTRREVCSAADHGRVRDRVVRGAEGTLADQLADRVRPGDRRHDRGNKRFLVAEWRQQTGYGASQKRLARARRPDHRHAVAARQSKLESPPRLQLATYFGKVRAILALSRLSRGKLGRQVRFVANSVGQLDSRRSALRAPAPAGDEKHGRLGQGFGRDDFDAARQFGLLYAFSGDYDATDPPSSKRRHHRQHARNGSQLSPKG